MSPVFDLPVRLLLNHVYSLLLENVQSQEQWDELHDLLSDGSASDPALARQKALGRMGAVV